MAKRGKKIEYHRQTTWPTVAALIEEAARLRGFEPWQVLHVTNKFGPAQTRHGIVWALRQMDVPYYDIARHLGMGDHTSALYCLNQAEYFRDRRPEYRQFTDDLLAFALTINPEQDAEAA